MYLKKLGAVWHENGMSEDLFGCAFTTCFYFPKSKRQIKGRDVPATLKTNHGHHTGEEVHVSFLFKKLSFPFFPLLFWPL